MGLFLALQHEKTYLRISEPKKDANQPTHLRIEVRFFPERILDTERCKSLYLDNKHSDQIARTVPSFILFWLFPLSERSFSIVVAQL